MRSFLTVVSFLLLFVVHETVSAQQTAEAELPDVAVLSEEAPSTEEEVVNVTVGPIPVPNSKTGKAQDVTFKVEAFTPSTPEEVADTAEYLGSAVEEANVARVPTSVIVIDGDPGAKKSEPHVRTDTKTLSLRQKLAKSLWDCSIRDPGTGKLEMRRVKFILIRGLLSGATIFTSLAISMGKEFSQTHALIASVIGMHCSGYLQFMMGKENWKSFFSPPPEKLMDLKTVVRSYGLELFYLNLVRIPLLWQFLEKNLASGTALEWEKQAVISAMGTVLGDAAWSVFLIKRYFTQKEKNPERARAAYNRNLLALSVLFLAAGICVAVHPELAWTIQVPAGVLGIVVLKYGAWRDYLRSVFRDPVDGRLRPARGIRQMFGDIKRGAAASKAVLRSRASFCREALARALRPEAKQTAR